MINKLHDIGKPLRDYCSPFADLLMKKVEKLTKEKRSTFNSLVRVRSDNIASKSLDGLLFRSAPEINMYKAFKSLGVSFAPLPVFIRGGESYRRVEPDFMIIKESY